MTIQDILKTIRCKRVHYGEGGEFTIPLNWESQRNMDYAHINQEQARMIAAATGKKLAPYTITLPNPNDALGIGKNTLTMSYLGSGDFMLRHHRNDFDRPVILPPTLDLSRYLKPQEAPHDRPNEMIPEDFYL